VRAVQHPDLDPRSWNPVGLVQSIGACSVTNQPPHDLDAERAVLGGLMLGGTANSITSADFYRPAHQLIFEAIEALRGSGKPTDPIAVSDELRRRSQLAKVGGGNYLHDCMRAAPSATQTAYYGRLVAEHAERRRLIEYAERLRDTALAPGAELADVRRLAAEQPEAGQDRRADANQSRRLLLTSAADIPPRPVQWGWEDRLPAAHVSIIAGREGIGKSLLLTWLAAQVTRGILPGVYEGTPRPVFYCATEDSWQHTIVPRLIAAGADLNLVYRVEVEAVEAAAGGSIAVELTMPRDCDLMAAEIKRLEVGLVALDPLMSVVDRTVDTYNDREMRTVLEPLARLADDTGCMIAGLGHFNKSASDDPLNLITGSRAFTAVVRAVLAAVRDPDADDGTCIVSQAKNNLGKLDLPNLTYVVREAIIETGEGDARVGRLHFTGESDRSVRDILADAGSAKDRSEVAKCMEWLREELAGGHRRTKEIESEAREQEFSGRTLVRARKKLGVQADQLATGTKGRNEWWLSLPGEAGGHDVA
jgi:hypothetical protein